jgi:hypothetical protein
LRNSHAEAAKAKYPGAIEFQSIGRNGNKSTTAKAAIKTILSNNFIKSYFLGGAGGGVGSEIVPGTTVIVPDTFQEMCNVQHAQSGISLDPLSFIGLSLASFRIAQFGGGFFTYVKFSGTFPEIKQVDV